MPELIEGPYKSEFLVTEAEGTLSRETVTVLLGQNLKPGHVLGRVTVGTATGVAVSGNVGNGTISAVSAGVGAKPGVYQVICIEPATNAGTFTLEDPEGVTTGRALVGTPFVGAVNFTLTDGPADFAAGDRFTVTVVEGSGKYKEYNPANTDGSQTAVAISLDEVKATVTDLPDVAIVRHAEVNAAELTWFAGADATQKAAGLAQLKTKTIIAR
ncbi:MAG: head decoration protein [Pseudomonadota bacterium]